MKYTVRNLDGDCFCVERSLWEASSVLRVQPEDGPPFYSVDASLETLALVLRAQHQGIYPDDLLSLLEILSLAEQLRLESISKGVFAQLRRKDDFYSQLFPVGCPIDAAVLVVTKLLETPFRTDGVYDDLLQRLSNLCARDEQIMANAINLKTDKQSQFLELGLEPLPVPLSSRLAPAAVINREGRARHTAVLHQNSWMELKLFGPRFDLESTNISEFYLKYGSYVLFKSWNSIYMKKLRPACSTEKVLDKCTHFVARERFVFAVVTERNPLKSSIMMWLEDESSMVPIYAVEKSEITFIDFECDRGVLVFQQEPNLIFVSRIIEGELIPLKCIEAENTICALIHKDTLSIFSRSDSKKWDSIERRCFALATDDFEEFGGLSIEANFSRNLSMKSRGGEIFQISDRGLHLAQEQLFLQTLHPGECKALGEIYLGV